MRERERERRREREREREIETGGGGGGGGPGELVACRIFQDIQTYKYADIYTNPDTFLVPLSLGN